MAPSHSKARAETPVSEAVIEAIADADDVSPTAMSPPLYRAIDPDALDALFRPSDPGSSTTGQLEFTYRGYAVTVHDDGRIDVRNLQQASDTES